MEEQKAVWKCATLAERLRWLAHSMAMEAAARDSKAFAVVADETRKLAEGIGAIAEGAPFPFPGGAGEPGFTAALGLQARRLGLLAINAAIESVNSEGGKAITICAEEVRLAALELEDFCSGATPRGEAGLPLLPEIASPSLASASREYMLVFSIGGQRALENFHFIREVLSFEAALGGLRGDELALWGRTWPFIDAARELGLSRECGEAGAVIIVKARWPGADGREYAVAIDGLCPGAFSRFPPGRMAGLRGSAFPGPWIRECWDAADGSQLLFLDWPALASR
jgi:hypothetical protein